MRLPWPTAALTAVAVLVVPACGVGGDAPPPPLAVEGHRSPPPPIEPPARLCDAIPGDAVARATGRSPVTVDGAGTQCSWRAPAAADGGSDVVLQGSFIDARSFEVARPVGGAAPVPGLGDDAFVVRVEGSAATTLYVRDGHQAFALWAEGTAGPASTQGALAELARRVLAG